MNKSLAISPLWFKQFAMTQMCSKIVLFSDSEMVMIIVNLIVQNIFNWDSIVWASLSKLLVYWSDKFMALSANQNKFSCDQSMNCALL